MYFISPLILPITKRIRAYHALRRMKPGGAHLDIGCGDGYLLRKSRCRVKAGLDEKLGTAVERKLAVRSGSQDYVTMLAVIEHLDHPREIMGECARVLKKGGLLIITTPVRKADGYINLYINAKEAHKMYFDRESLKGIAGKKLKLVEYKKFEFGLNQLFVFRKV